MQMKASVFNKLAYGTVLKLFVILILQYLEGDIDRSQDLTQTPYFALVMFTNYVEAFFFLTFLGVEFQNVVSVK